MKKLILILLCAAMLLAVAAGCAGGADEPAIDESSAAEELPSLDDLENGPDDSEAEPNENGDESERDCFIMDFYGAFHTFDPDTIMMTTAGDLTVTWEELFFGLHIAIMSVLEHLGEITDWYEVFADNMTLAESVLSMAEDHILRFKATEYGANLHGAVLSQEMQTFARIQMDTFIEMYGGEDGFLEFLWYDIGIRRESLFESIFKTYLLMDAIFEEVFGQDNILLTDRMVEDFFAERDDGFMMAKHILVSFGDDPENAQVRADGIWNRLNQYTGDDIELFFDELMREYSEDPGLANFPQGYLFQFFDMVPEFSQGTHELEIGQFSHPIETIHGFHIILRLPLALDEVPISFMNIGRFETLRDFAAMNLFSAMAGDWFDALRPVHTAEFNSIVLSEIFLPC